MRSCANIVSAVFVIAVTAVESAEIMSESCTDERCLVGASSWQESMANAMLQVHQRQTRNRTVEEDPESMKDREPGEPGMPGVPGVPDALEKSQSLEQVAISGSRSGSRSAITHESAGETNGVPEAVPLRVRYAGLAYDMNYITETMLPQLSNSICLVERWLGPSTAELTYTIYTSSLSDGPLKSMINNTDRFCRGDACLMPRISFLNLDEDPNDKIRMSAYENLPLDDVNRASIRRMLADASLPDSENRLLLGADISFLQRPDDLLEKIQRSKVVYMTDYLNFGGVLYRVAADKGPQCEGLLGDLFYLGAGIRVREEDMQKALKFYVNLPHNPPRITPVCPVDLCDRVSNGLHATDQFAWAMILGKASNGTCVPLDREKYLLGGSQWHGQRAEAIHDKETNRCQWSYKPIAVALDSNETVVHLE
jgi:hypothetical protein